MAAPTIRSLTTKGETASATTTSVTTPSAQVGDLLVIIASNDFYLMSDVALQSISPSATATQVTACNADAGSNLAHVKVWTAPVVTAGAVTVTTVSTHTDEERALIVYIIAGAAGGGANTGSIGTGTGTTWTCTSMTTTSPDCLVLAHWQGDSTSGGSTLAPPGGAWTTQYDDLLEGTFSRAEGASNIFTAAGATGTFSATTSASHGFAASAVAIAGLSDATFDPSQPQAQGLYQTPSSIPQIFIGDPDDTVGDFPGQPPADLASALLFVPPGLYASPWSVAWTWLGDDTLAMAGDHIVTVNQTPGVTGDELDLAQPITLVQSSITVVVNQATETDLAQPMDWSRQAPTPDPDTQLEFDPVASLAGPQTTGTWFQAWLGDDARAIPYQVIFVNQTPSSTTDEVDLAQPVTLIQQGITVAVGQATEADLAQPLNALDAFPAADPNSDVQFIAPGLYQTPSSVPTLILDPAGAISGPPVIVVNQALEDDLAQPITLVQQALTITVNQAVETDLAQPMDWSRQAPTPDPDSQLAIVAQAAFVSPTTAGTWLQAWLGDDARAVPYQIIFTDQALETDLAQPVTLIQQPITVVVGQALETDLAQPIGIIQAFLDADPTTQLAFLAPGIGASPNSVAVGWDGFAVGGFVTTGQALEVDLAQPVTPVKDQLVALAQAVETDLAQAIAALKPITILVGQPGETDLAQHVTVTAGIIPGYMTSLSGNPNLSGTSGGAQLNTSPASGTMSSDSKPGTMSTRDQAQGGLTDV